MLDNNSAVSDLWICRYRNCHGLAAENAAVKGPVAWDTASVTGNIWAIRHTHSRQMDLFYRHGAGDIKITQIFLWNCLQIKAWITTDHVHGDLGHCRIIYQSTQCDHYCTPKKLASIKNKTFWTWNWSCFVLTKGFQLSSYKIHILLKKVICALVLKELLMCSLFW
jgi:hypothetical protein